MTNFPRTVNMMRSSRLQQLSPKTVESFFFFVGVYIFIRWLFALLNRVDEADGADNERGNPTKRLGQV